MGGSGLISPTEAAWGHTLEAHQAAALPTSSYGRPPLELYPGHFSCPSYGK